MLKGSQNTIVHGALVLLTTLCLQINPGGRVLELVEQQRSPLTKERLASIRKVDEAPLDLNRLSHHVFVVSWQILLMQQDL